MKKGKLIKYWPIMKTLEYSWNIIRLQSSQILIGEDKKSKNRIEVDMVKL